MTRAPFRAPSRQCLVALRSLIFNNTLLPTASHQIAIRCYSIPSHNGNLPAPPSSSPKSSRSPTLSEPTRASLREGPKPLTHLLGVSSPPQVGENWGIDTRSLRQRRDDFVDHEKHLAKRRDMTKQLFRPYFKDFNDVQYAEGKVFIAPERVFRKDAARYFPNLRGRSLLDNQWGETTGLLQGRITFVTLVGSAWGEAQIKSWLDDDRLKEVLDKGTTDNLENVNQKSGNIAQLVQINWEPNWFKYWLIKLFAYRQRLSRMKEQWQKYLMVHNGFDEDLRLSVGMSNQKVGHVYLVDKNCKIRWAAQAMASEGEKDNMIKAFRRLLDPDNTVEQKTIAYTNKRSSS